MATLRSSMTSTGGNQYLTRVYDASNLDELSKVYDEWAATFNADMEPSSQDYVAPMLVADAVVRNLTCNSDLHILDAGCGTGLASLALTRRLSTSSSSSDPSPPSTPPSSSLSDLDLDIDGVDFSPAMLNIARATNLYQSLREADLNRPLSSIGIAESTYDAVICVGTLTHGHVGPGALEEFARATKPEGIVVATVLQDIWESGGFRAEVERLVRGGEVVVVEDEVRPYRRAAGVVARIVVLRKIAGAAM